MSDAERVLHDLYAKMRNEDRELYRGQNGRWYLTHGGGPFSENVVEALQKLPGIVPRYKADGRLQYDCFAYGKTIDLDETLRRRRAGEIHKRARVYVDGSMGG